VIPQTLDKVRVRGERVVLEKHGKPVAAIVPMDDLELLEEIDESLVDEGLVAEAKERQAAGRRGISLAEAKARLGL
jgi:prevent-host-death family protein